MRLAVLAAIAILLAGCASPSAEPATPAPTANPTRHKVWYDASVVPTPEGAWSAYRWSLPADAALHTDGTAPGVVIDLVPEWNGDGGRVDAWAMLFFVERAGRAAFAGGFVTSDQWGYSLNDPTPVRFDASLIPVNLLVGYGNLVSLLSYGSWTQGLYGNSLNIEPGETVYAVVGAKGPVALPFHIAFRSSEGDPQFTAGALDPATEVESALAVEQVGSAQRLAVDYYSRKTSLAISFETWTDGIHHSDAANPVYGLQDAVNIEQLSWQGGKASAGWGRMAAHARSIGSLEVQGTMAMLDDTREVDVQRTADDTPWGQFAEGDGAGNRFMDLSATDVGGMALEDLTFFVVAMDSPLVDLLGLPACGADEEMPDLFPPS